MARLERESEGRARGLPHVDEDLLCVRLVRRLNNVVLVCDVPGELSIKAGEADKFRNQLQTYPSLASSFTHFPRMSSVSLNEGKHNESANGSVPLVIEEEDKATYHHPHQELSTGAYFLNIDPRRIRK
jgi:hypothetical protein